MKRRGIRMERIRRKKGVSPIIATVMLITLVVLLAAIIFWWARGFFGERLEKFDKPADQACQDISFDAQEFSGGIDIINNGNVPLAGVSLSEYSPGKSQIETFDFVQGLVSGKTASVNVQTDYERIIVIPRIMVSSPSGERPYTCNEEFGVEI